MADIELNTIYNEDCLETMRRMPDGFVDLVLTDPPYGITAINWDSPVDFMQEALRVGGTVVCTASQPFTSDLVYNYRKYFKCEWIWAKNNGSGFLNAKFMPLKEHESILVFSLSTPYYKPILQERFGLGRDRAKYARTRYKAASSHYGKLDRTGKYNAQALRNPGSVQFFDTEVGLHPTQKPLKLFSYLVKTYSKAGSIIYDPFMGSGTTARACKDLGRNYIGSEISKEYCEIAEKRLRQEVLL